MMLERKARKDRWAWNFGIQKGRPIAIREDRLVGTCHAPIFVTGA